MKLIGPYKWVLVEELPFEQLYTKYADHKRLGVFAQKGCGCSVPGCTKVATRLIITQERTKKGVLLPKFHVDLYTDDYQLMNVDHHHPKSKGGPDSMKNKNPMCYRHNIMKGAKMPGTFEFSR